MKKLISLTLCLMSMSIISFSAQAGSHSAENSAHIHDKEAGGVYRVEGSSIDGRLCERLGGVIKNAEDMSTCLLGDVVFAYDCENLIVDLVRDLSLKGLVFYFSNGSFEAVEEEKKDGAQTVYSSEHYILRVTGGTGELATAEQKRSCKELLL